MVKEHLCTVAVDVAMGEEHADGEGRLDIIRQVQEGFVGTSYKYFAVSSPLRASLVSHAPL